MKTQNSRPTQISKAMAKKEFLLAWILVPLLLQSCAVHNTMKLYRSLTPEQVTEVRVSYSDSANAKGAVDFNFDKNDSYFNSEAFKATLGELLAGKDTTTFSKDIDSRPWEKLRRHRLYLSLTISREKDWCIILPYIASVKFFSATKGDGVVTVGHMGSPVVYSEYKYLTGVEDINKLIAFTNVLVRRYNETMGAVGKKTIPTLPLVE